MNSIYSFFFNTENTQEIIPQPFSVNYVREVSAVTLFYLKFITFASKLSKLYNLIAAYGKLTQMKGHMKWDHGDIPRTKPQKRPYLCSICGQGFVAKSGLKLHLMRHNNMRPFKCTESGCEKSFVTTRERNDHLR